MKKNTVLWSVSLMVIGVATIILSVANIAGVELADIAVRILGGAEVVACPVLVFTTVRKIKWGEWRNDGDGGKR